ncbi:MAG: hypothetical protein NVSMB4_04150 [Acidimicrobiales bacterium]
MVEAGQASCVARTCLMPTRWIAPADPWDLDHTDDGLGYRGPAHRRCNQMAGASRGGKATSERRSRRPRGNAHSVDW